MAHFPLFQRLTPFSLWRKYLLKWIDWLFVRLTKARTAYAARKNMQGIFGQEDARTHTYVRRTCSDKTAEKFKTVQTLKPHFWHVQIVKIYNAVFPISVPDYQVSMSIRSSFLTTMCHMHANQELKSHTRPTRLIPNSLRKTHLRNNKLRAIRAAISLFPQSPPQFLATLMWVDRQQGITVTLET